MNRESALYQVEAIACILLLLSTADKENGRHDKAVNWLGGRLEEAAEALASGRWS